jgi:hypothetical protein
MVDLDTAEHSFSEHRGLIRRDFHLAMAAAAATTPAAGSNMGGGRNRAVHHPVQGTAALQTGWRDRKGRRVLLEKAANLPHHPVKIRRRERALLFGDQRAKLRCGRANETDGVPGGCIASGVRNHE